MLRVIRIATWSDSFLLEARTVTPRPFFPSFFLGKTGAHAPGWPSPRAGVASARRLRTRVPLGIRWDALRARGAASPSAFAQGIVTGWPRPGGAWGEA